MAPPDTNNLDVAGRDEASRLVSMQENESPVRTVVDQHTDASMTSKLEKLKLMMGDEELYKGQLDDDEESENGTKPALGLAEIAKDTNGPQESTWGAANGTPEWPAWELESKPQNEDTDVQSTDWKGANIEAIIDCASDTEVPPWQIFTVRQVSSTHPSREKIGPSHVSSTAFKHSLMVLKGSFESVNAIGELAPPDSLLCPVGAVAKYPYRHINKKGQEKVSTGFFAGNKFWKRIWNIYYLYPPPFTAPKPLLLVPAYQVLEFLMNINDAYGTELTFPPEPEKLGFLISFPNNNTPRPRYLGCSQRKDMFEKLSKKIPAEDFKPPGEPHQQHAPSERSMAAWRENVEKAIELSKHKNKLSKHKKRQERFERQQGWGRQVKRAQRYLGLRQKRQDVNEADVVKRSAVNPGDRWGVDDVMEAADHRANVARDTSLIGFDTAAPFPADFLPVFICVDVEANEYNHKQITEIGIASLDTIDLAGLAPGEGGKNWMSKIRARHFRIKEYSHIINKVHVSGCPDRFEFGESEMISIKDAPAVVASCFKAPYIKTINHADEDQGSEDGEIQDSRPEKRNIVLLGHDINTDIDFLKAMGYNPLNLPNMVEVLDTGLMYRSLKRELSSRSLGTLLYELGLMGWNLHNAGNDAVYTLQVMLAIVFRDLVVRGKDVGSRAAEKAEHIQQEIERAVEHAKGEARDKLEGWSSGGEASDGGAPAIPKQKEGHSQLKTARGNLSGMWRDPAPTSTRQVARPAASDPSPGQDDGNVSSNKGPVWGGAE
ncbi:MAG: hypothetical protein M1833_000598 [Piccolia ochrophora]|nr:MAG: hypothetical protein M1833_000598 [Piccolia ochrophora]